MKLTEKQIESNLKAYGHAIRTGDTSEVQYLNSEINPSRWVDKKQSGFFVDQQYRVRPDTRLRQWTAEEFPFKAIFRHGTENTELWMNVVMFHPGSGTVHFSSVDSSLAELATAIMGWHHSIDHGKTWLPCGVMEEAT